MAGKQWENIPEAPVFDTEADAQAWAQEWMNKNPRKSGLESVGLLKLITAKGEHNA